MKRKVEQFLLSKNIDGIRRLKDEATGLLLIGTDVEGCLRALREPRQLATNGPSAETQDAVSCVPEDGQPSSKSTASCNRKGTAGVDSYSPGSDERTILPGRNMVELRVPRGADEDSAASASTKPAQNPLPIEIPCSKGTSNSPGKIQTEEGVIVTPSKKGLHSTRSNAPANSSSDSSSSGSSSSSSNMGGSSSSSRSSNNNKAQQVGKESFGLSCTAVPVVENERPSLPPNVRIRNRQVSLPEPAIADLSTISKVCKTGLLGVGCISSKTGSDPLISIPATSAAAQQITTKNPLRPPKTKQQQTKATVVGTAAHKGERNSDTAGEDEAGSKPWTCECGNLVAARKKRCRRCHRWRRGKRETRWCVKVKVPPSTAETPASLTEETKVKKVAKKAAKSTRFQSTSDNNIRDTKGLNSDAMSVAMNGANAASKAAGFKRKTLTKTCVSPMETIVKTVKNDACGLTNPSRVGKKTVTDDQAVGMTQKHNNDAKAQFENGAALGGLIVSLDKVCEKGSKSLAIEVPAFLPEGVKVDDVANKITKSTHFRPTTYCNGDDNQRSEYGAITVVNSVKAASKSTDVTNKTPTKTYLSPMKTKPQQLVKTDKNNAFGLTKPPPKDKKTVPGDQGLKSAFQKYYNDTKALFKGSTALGNFVASPDKVCERRSKSLVTEIQPSLPSKAKVDKVAKKAANSAHFQSTVGNNAESTQRHVNDVIAVAMNGSKVASNIPGIKNKTPTTIGLSSVKTKPQKSVKTIKNDAHGLVTLSHIGKQTVPDNQSFTLAFQQHCNDTKALLKVSAACGDSSVSPDKMRERRSKNLRAFSSANRLMSEQELKKWMLKAESEAVLQFTQELKSIQGHRPEAA